jgi:3-deoxy-D-manno-octulosonate 8-phosphate phosphatase (KDO 8-P phosphatase)
MADFNSRAAAIRLVCFDVDGTLTDGRLIFDSQGHESKAFHVHDGQGLRLLEDSGIAVALITARQSRIVQTRGSDLRLKYVYDGVKDKLAVLQSICIQEGLTLNQVAYMGDDYPDLACLQSVGLATCPADAMPAIRNSVHWCSSRPGGSGAARELADLILTVQGKLEALQHRYGAP